MSSSSLGLSFQTVIATDGANTFMWTYYYNVNVEPPVGRKVAIGYSVSGQFKSNMYSLTEAAFCLSIFRGNIKKSKQMYYN